MIHSKSPLNVIRLVLNSMKSSKFHLFSIVFASICISAILYWQSENTRSVDPIPELFQLDKKALARASQVTVGLHIQSFPMFSFKQNDFTVDGIIWFRFPSGSESLSTIENFAIENSIAQSSGKLIHKSPPIITLDGNDVIVSYHIQTSFKTPLYYKKFPMSEHRLNIVIQNRSTTPQELSFISHDSNLTIDKENLVQDWAPGKQTVRTGYSSAPLTNNNKKSFINYPTVIFSTEFKCLGIRDLISLYFPMFVLFFIALFCLLIDITDISRLSYVATAVPILVLFRMVIDAQSPNVGYSTHIDFMYHALVFFSLMILLFETYVVLTLHNVKELTNQRQEQIKKRLYIANDIVFFLILAASVLCVAYSVFR